MSFGVTELIIILVIVLLLFGTSKLKSLGTDLGSAIKGFRSAVTDEEAQKSEVAENDEGEKTVEQTSESSQ
ncbi:MAG: twin-arginine translocase TatA/TatE family subunit [Pseudomonadales bacterium]|nr:twin-arginine translocase TatA/TatE family subunit [Pseudomonadales bacterium]MBO6597751.1 twin-arginine translocase TatA/TatE family subunit [Pseudomonadales bacterium]MBO6655963.1 twin-arginine translocase TatA/TatE family subunit [Pseudomonadales bacterium]MBO6704066.1 twin-arginine translocase TatA/TatE family subunit [Pseudomonadales bacterium]MBO6823989.1 twin-arginine translocase TatA/TatE family subunit [Pseudomonadales bacterium]